MLEIALLGRFEVRSDGERIELPSRTQQRLLAYLALRAGQTVPRPKLAGLLWPDVPEAKARKNLRHHLWRLRQAIGEECLATSQETVALDAAVLDCLDADVLAQNIGDGDLAGLVVAVSAYKGELLPGFYDDWVQVDRERLQALFERQMDTLLERLAAEGRWSNLVRWSEHWIALVQAPEPAYRALMRGHAGLGDLAAVARVYERCQKALRKELGVEPAPQTRALYDSLRAGQAVPPRVNTLPLHSMPFVGRQRELAQLDQSLADTDVRLITISGVGGAGKTRLAYAAAERQLQRQPPLFADGVYAASLASYDSPEQLLPAIADAVGLPSRQGALELDHLTNHLREKAVLLVLDNFEHLLEGAGVLAKLLQGTANLKVLVTSRERLALRQERVFPLGGLADGQAHSADDAREDPFLQLFLHSARRVRPDFELVSEDLEHVARLRHMTGGLPLAVELAASWVEVLPLAEIVGEMGRDLDFLQSDLRDLPRRQRSMRAVFEAAWRRLEPEQRAHFSYLCLFRGGFTREAAQEVAGASLRTLATLSAKSLVEYDAARDRYEIHELLRQFGERELQKEPDEEHQVRRCHAVFYCQWLRQKQQAWVSDGAAETPAEMDQERGNVRLAWKWAAEQGEVSLMAQSLYALGAYYIVRGPFVEARRLLRTVESLLSAPAESAEEIARRRLLARVVHWQGRKAPSLGEARSELDRAETMLAELRQ